MPKPFRLLPDQLKELKARVRARDGHKCRKCKSSSAHAVHHIIFLSDSGQDLSNNLVLLCDRCHSACHGIISNYFLVIINPESDLIPPDADKGLKFITYNKVQRRIRWRQQ